MATMAAGLSLDPFLRFTATPTANAICLITWQQQKGIRERRKSGQQYGQQANLSVVMPNIKRNQSRRLVILTLRSGNENKHSGGAAAAAALSPLD